MSGWFHPEMCLVWLDTDDSSAQEHENLPLMITDLTLSSFGKREAHAVFMVHSSFADVGQLGL